MIPYLWGKITMKKLVLTDFKHIEMVEGEIPVPGPGQAVVRIRYAGICGSDLHVFSGLHPSARVPLVMGHEGCGELYAINDSRTDVKVGDKVCVHTISPCNSCEYCTTGRENLCQDVKIMGTNFDGVFTQYMLADAKRLIRFDDHVDLKLAALAEPLTVAVHDVRRSNLQVGESVFITGAGPIGLIIGMLAKYSGATQVVFSELNPLRIAMAQEFGFTVLNPEAPDFEQACRAANGGSAFDAAFEITSVQSGFNTCLSQVKKGGVVIQVGMPPAGSQRSVDIDKIIFGETELRGVRHHTISDMQCAVNIINSGTMNSMLSRLITAVYPMADYAKALERAASDKSMLRVLMDFS